MAHTGKSLTLEEKNNVLSVQTYFEKEKIALSTAVKNGSLSKSTLPIKYNQVRKRTSEALSINESTVTRVLNQLNQEGEVKPPKHQDRGRKKIELDSFAEGVVRRAVMMNYSNKIHPTLDSLHHYLQEDPNFPRMSRQTLWRRMRKQLKFKFERFQGKPVVMERDDIRAQRHHYLRAINKYRENGYEIFYTDETWCSENHSLTSGWHIPEKEILGMGNTRPHIDIWLKGVGKRFIDGMIGGISSKPSGAGKRIIIIQIGSENGFLEGTGKVFIGKKNTSDYHHKMNSAHFEEWFSIVLEKIPNHTLIVLDQATYHKRITNETKNPTTAWRKQEVIDWLEKNSIPIPEPYDSFSDMTVPMLRVLADKHKIESVFVVDELIKKSGKDVKILWLPVAHCELNPIELIWSKVKREVAKKNGTFKINDVQILCQNEINNVNPDLWKSCILYFFNKYNIQGELTLKYTQCILY